MNGSDHVAPQPGLPAALEAALAQLPGTSAEIGTLPGFLARARARGAGEPPGAPRRAAQRPARAAAGGLRVGAHAAQASRLPERPPADALSGAARGLARRARRRRRPGLPRSRLADRAREPPARLDLRLLDRRGARPDGGPLRAGRGHRAGAPATGGAALSKQVAAPADGLRARRRTRGRRLEPARVRSRRGRGRARARPRRAAARAPPARRGGPQDPGRRGADRRGRGRGELHAGGERRRDPRARDPARVHGDVRVRAHLGGRRARALGPGRAGHREAERLRPRSRSRGAARLARRKPARAR